MQVELLSITPNAEKHIERCGRVAYQSEDKITDESHKAFIKKIIQLGHESVIEHAVATFKISGISRACSHQLVRHRLVSYTQVSQRCVSIDGLDYTLPKSISNNPNPQLIDDYRSFISNSLRLYKKLQDGGVRNEDARYVLPNACNTMIVLTANFRELRHIIKLRTGKGAQWEIRELAYKMLNILKKHAPIVFGDIE